MVMQIILGLIRAIRHRDCGAPMYQAVTVSLSDNSVTSVFKKDLLDLF
jgi:hypothetical protein